MAELLAYMTSTGLLDEAELQDPEYAAYCKRVDDPGTYEEWQSMVEELERLGKVYDEECAPHFYEGASWNYRAHDRAREILRMTNSLEVALGY